MMLMDVMEIQKILPHRFPFLLVDRITALVPGESVEGYKNVTIGERFGKEEFEYHPERLKLLNKKHLICLI